MSDMYWDAWFDHVSWEHYYHHWDEEELLIELLKCDNPLRAEWIRRWLSDYNNEV